nr:MAG TPA: hypothetical protein [Caudoviricetes sp.]
MRMSLWKKNNKKPELARFEQGIKSFIQKRQNVNYTWP